MSILIKGAEMPTNCEECQTILGCCDTQIDGTVWCRLAQGYIGDKRTVCPLVPVPPHGDLIDQEKYRDEFMDGVYDLCNDDPDNYRANAIIDLFDAAPTIIPAEEPKVAFETLLAMFLSAPTIIPPDEPKEEQDG